MGERGDVGRANGIVARGKRGSAQVASGVDGSDLPPLEVRLGCATLVTLNIILYQYFRFVGIVPITPPARQRAGPRGLTTMPFWLGLYRPSIIGRSRIFVIALGVAPTQVGVVVVFAIAV